jgi:parvulin-like peptidyl-prolyl isomerase
VEAPFALQNPGDVSPPVVTERGFSIIKLEQRRPGFAAAEQRRRGPEPAAAPLGGARAQESLTWWRDWAPSTR